MIAIVVTDVGKASIEKLLAVRAPITVAIEPYTHVCTSNRADCGERVA